MHRYALAFLGVLAGAGITAAQGVDASRVHPITVPIRDAGTLDLASRTWRGPHAGARSSTVVYDNTCTYWGGAAYVAIEHCEDAYDEGRVPSTTSPGAPPGAEDQNRIDGFQIAYCTHFPTGTVDIKVSWWNHNGGGCLTGTAQGAIVPPFYNGATAYVDLAGAGLPGDNQGGGNLACWAVTIDLSNTPNGGFCLESDGNGTWNGGGDEFNWAFQHENPNSVFGPNGPVIAAEPLVAPFGACSYNLPCGTDLTTGAPCGTGLGTIDSLWDNIDGTALGGPVNPATCPNGTVGGTGCYTFGGWPIHPFASLWLEMTSSGDCLPDQPVTYCTAKVNTQGCTPAIGWTGTPSASQPVVFDVWAIRIINQKNGLLFYGFQEQAVPFHNGWLCVKPPIVRTAVQSSGGNPPPPDCSGTFHYDFNALIQSGVDPQLVAGTQVYAQYWYRDPGSPQPSNIGLTDALRFPIGP